MDIIFIIIVCCLLLTGYLFDLSYARTKVPSVVLLLFLGWGIRQLSILMDIKILELGALLSIFGTVGLILIVLEGSLELEAGRSKRKLFVKSSLSAFLSLLVLSFVFAILFHLFSNYSFKQCLANAIPLSIISSAIAIPSVRNMGAFNKEFVTYESSISDILGVIFFNFIALNETIEASTFGYFFLQMFVITIVSFIATLGLSYLLSKSNHHVKYIPIIIFIVLIYAIFKMVHLPALMFIMIFGLFLGNFHKFKKTKWIEVFQPDKMKIEVHKFREVVIESTFLIRTLFFLLFGYLIETKEILDTQSVIWSLGIVGGIFIIRYFILKILSLSVKPLLYIAPRGLITILLFLAVTPTLNISFINKSLIIQVIILTSLIMMIGLIRNSRKKNNAKAGKIDDSSVD
ncbi:MAG: cation:proton antiporter [Bacteroidota bacterium]